MGSIYRWFLLVSNSITTKFIVGLLVFGLINTSAQNINDLVSQQVNHIRSGKNASREALKRSIEKDPESLLNVLSSYQNDTLPEVRRFVLSLYQSILDSHLRPLDLRQKITLKMVEKIDDADIHNRNICVDNLTGCYFEDFSEESKSKFCAVFNKQGWFSKELILLAGFIAPPDCKSTLEQLAYTPASNQRRYHWSAYVALSRMGDNNAINWCLAKVQSIPLNDDLTEVLLPDLVYTRQPRIYEYLVSVLNSDEKLCSSSNPDMDVSILCGYRVMEYLAPVIKKYPLKLLPSGDIDTKDYHKSLLSVREWLARQNGKYEIISNTF